MITRFYADNYKCLTNFEYKPKPFELIVGANGTGKSTVFEALDKVASFVSTDTKSTELFSIRTLTRWDERTNQRFEIDVSLKGDHYQYVLGLAYRLEMGAVAVHEESLKRNGDFLFAFEREWQEEETDEGILHHLVGKLWFQELEGLEDIEWSNGERSILSQFEKRQVPLATQFKEFMGHVYFIKLNPMQMLSETRAEVLQPKDDLSNFASWYRHLVQVKQKAVFELYTALKDVMSAFEEMRFTVYGQTARVLEVVLRGGTNANNKLSKEGYSLEELSDGQRALIALYTLLFCTLETGTTLVIDEPENYIALRELQPWLMLLQERLEEHGGQVILISHHPEFINQMAPQNAVQFVRDNNGPVRVMPFPVAGFEGLTPGEIMARGWNLETAS